MADRGSNRGSSWIAVVVLALLAVGVMVVALWPGEAVASAAGADSFTELFSQGLQKQKGFDYAAAAALFGQAEQSADTIDEKAQAAYFQGNAYFEAHEYNHAAQSFQRVMAYGQELAQAQESTQGDELASAKPRGRGASSPLIKYVSMAEIAVQDCLSCLNPLNDFPTSMYLWIKSKIGTAALITVDKYFNIWDNIKIYLYAVILLMMLLRTLIKIKRRKTKKADSG